MVSGANHQHRHMGPLTVGRGRILSLIARHSTRSKRCALETGVSAPSSWRRSSERTSTSRVSDGAARLCGGTFERLRLPRRRRRADARRARIEPANVGRSPADRTDPEECARDFMASQKDLAMLSERGRHRITTSEDRHIQLFDPGAVVDAVRCVFGGTVAPIAPDARRSRGGP